MLSPVVKLHIYKTHTFPILRTGLSSFSIRTAQIEPLALFQRKTLKSILKLSISAPTPAIHFLSGELPIEGKIHMDIFSLFFGVWRNPDTKIYEIIRYLLNASCENSRTWHSGRIAENAHSLGFLKPKSKRFGLYLRNRKSKNQL